MARSAVPFVAALASHGHRPAIVAEDRVLTYEQLAGRVSACARRLRPEDGRRLVLVGAANRLDAIVAYLATLAAGHVALLADARDATIVERLVERYDPDLVVSAPRAGDPDATVTERRHASTHELHPDLALLLSTSGSTGSPKLVRLSHANLESNARAIAGYLEITPDDRAATTLPMQYSYGLSVINSHLASGASVVLTERSVTDRCFWEEFRAAEATSFAGVPYTFELLDRIGFEQFDLPTLRTVTQAGGRLAPDRVRALAELGLAQGWRFFVMYGQTEATARMAYLPPELARSHPHAVGVPIPGGAVRIEPVPDAPAGTGELVYRGPNVMLGYAERPRDLARGRDIDELRTGDLARITGPGLVELVGRRQAFVKVAGLRIDLAQAELNLAGAGLRACAAGRDEQLAVAVETEDEPAQVRRQVLATLGLPPHAVRVLAVPSLPRRPNGKPDRTAVLALAEATLERTGEREAGDPPAARDSPAPEGPGAQGVKALYASLLERDVRETDSFTSLGGDSLSYVQVSLGLEEILGRLPEAWPEMEVRELERRAEVARAARAARAGTPSGRWRVPFGRLRPLVDAVALRTVDATVVLRALAILLIVGTHIGLVHALGGAHVLFAVAGYNFARFQLGSAPRRERLRAQARSIARLVVPTVLWIGIALVVANDYELHNLFLLNAIVGPPPFTPTWHFWFIELLAYILVAAAAVLAVPAVDRLERRRPLALALAVLAVGLGFRFHVLELGLLMTRPVLWLFALGWAAQRARTWPQRGLLVGVAAAAVPGFYADTQRELIIFLGLALLVLVRTVRVPAILTPVAGVLASASLYIYLVHWQVYPHLTEVSQVLAMGASLAAGITVWAAAPRAARLVSHRLPVRWPAARWRPGSTASKPA